MRFFTQQARSLKLNQRLKPPEELYPNTQACTLTLLKEIKIRKSSPIDLTPARNIAPLSTPTPMATLQRSIRRRLRLDTSQTSKRPSPRKFTPLPPRELNQRWIGIPLPEADSKPLLQGRSREVTASRSRKPPSQSKAAVTKPQPKERGFC